MQHQMITGTLLAILLLSSCSKNPLQEQPVDEAARLLSNASSEVMESMGVHEPGISDRYAQCMEHRAKSSFDCGAFYNAMAHNLAQKGFSVRRAQIQDPKLYARVKDELQQRSFFSM